MAPTAPGPPQNFEVRPIYEFDDVGRDAPPGRRAESLREAAGAFRRRFQHTGFVHTVRSVELVAIPCPARLALGGLAGPANPWVTLIGRLVVVQFDDFERRLRTLAFSPMLADSVARAPVHMPPGRPILRPGGPRELSSVQRGLAQCELMPASVELVAFGDLRGTDLRRLAGTTRAPVKEHQPWQPVFESARFLVRAPELEQARSPHPIQARWYVPGAVDDVPQERLQLVDGDIELGAGVALLATPGRSTGHQTLVLNTPGGIWVVSDNGAAADCWQPLLSKVPGVRRSAEAEGLEVMLATGAAESAAQLYESMVLERSIADASIADPRWLTILPTQELAARGRQWPALATFSHGGLNFGRARGPK
jgi:hypothetical protein